jgi:hypothetical protein
MDGWRRADILECGGWPPLFTVDTVAPHELFEKCGWHRKSGGKAPALQSAPRWPPEGVRYKGKRKAELFGLAGAGDDHRQVIGLFAGTEFLDGLLDGGH